MLLLTLVGPTCWTKGKSTKPLPKKNETAQYVTGAWVPPSKDGMYDIRVVALCTPSGNADFDVGSTPVMSGIVDRAAPRLVTVFPTSHATT